MRAPNTLKGPKMADEFRGKMGALESDEVDAFLGADNLARVACLKPDGSPYVVPLWYQWDGTDLWFVGRERADWASYMKADPRVSVVIDAPHSDPEKSGLEVELPKVWVEGNAEVVEEPNIGGQWVSVAEEMSYRYLGPNGPTYLTSTMQQPRWLIRVRPTRMKTWKGVGWSPKYWVDETGGPSYQEVHS